MGIYNLGEISITTAIPAVHKGNALTLFPTGKGLTLKLKYNSKKNELLFWQPTGFFGLGKKLGIQVKKLTKGRRVDFEYEGATEYKKDGQRVFAKTRMHWIITSNDSVNFNVELSY